MASRENWIGGVFIKVYIAHYDNGEGWEDHYHSYGEKVYVNKNDCEKEILENGYIREEKSDERFNPNRVRYIRKDEYYYEWVVIEELELIG